jgi:MFS family permease
MTLEPIWTRAFCLLTLSHLLGALGYASMLLLPLYLTFLGGSRSEVGLIMSSAHLAGLATRPIVGWSLDRFGRHSSLIFGGVVTALSLAAVYLITAIDYTAYGVRILFGIGEGFIFTGYFAFAADLIPKSRRTEGLALFGVAGLLPLLVNPIADITGFQGEGLRPFLTSVSVLVLLSAILILLIPSETSKQSKMTELPLDDSNNHATIDKSPKDDLSVQSDSFKATIVYLFAPHMRPLWWSTIAFAGAVALLMTFGSVVSASRGMIYPTAVWFTYVGGAVMARLFGAKLPEKLGPAKLVAPSLSLYGVALLIYAQSVEMWGMLLAGALAGVAHGYCFPVLTSLIVSAVDERYRGRALATFTGLWGGAAIIFAPLGGYIADHWSDERMLIFFGSLLLCASVYAKPSRFIDQSFRD